MHKVTLLVLLLFTASCGGGGGAEPSEPLPSLIVVANRADGTISVISSETLQVVDTVSLPDAANPSQPGYVVYSEPHNRLYVGDIANHRIVVLSGTDFTHITDLPTEEDVFHIWHNNTQLWAVDRTNKSVAVFDIATHRRITVIPMPTDLIAAGGEPHDVVVDANHAFVSVLGIENAPDVVVRYSTRTLTETGRVPVGEDPHLFLHPTTPNLYVACQDSDAVFVFDRESLAAGPVIPVDGGHGVWIPPHGERLYVTNFAGHEVVGPPDPQGPFALTTVNLSTHLVVDATHASDTGPHNIASNEAGTRLFITHTNGGTNVTVYEARVPEAPPRETMSIQVGANPFGLCRVR